MLAYSRYFLGYPRFCLTRIRKAKVVEGDLAVYSIGNISIKGVSVWSISAEADSAGGYSAVSTYVSAGLFGTGS